MRTCDDMNTIHTRLLVVGRGGKQPQGFNASQKLDFSAAAASRIDNVIYVKVNLYQNRGKFS